MDINTFLINDENHQNNMILSIQCAVNHDPSGCNAYLEIALSSYNEIDKSFFDCYRDAIEALKNSDKIAANILRKAFVQSFRKLLSPYKNFLKHSNNT